MRVAFLFLSVFLVGCAQPVANDGQESGTSTSAAASQQAQSFLVLTITGNVSQTPPYAGQTAAACGRPMGPYAGLDFDEARLVIVRDATDFDRDASWVVVNEDVGTIDDSSSCDLAWVFAAEGDFHWTYGDVNVSIERAASGLRVGDAMIQSGETHIVHVDTAGPEGSRFVGDVSFRVFGPWLASDIIEVDREQEVTHGAGFWTSTRP